MGLLALSGAGRADAPPLETLEDRLSYVEYLLERYPNILRANLQYRRNLIDVLGSANETIRLLGPLANPMDSPRLSTLTLSYSPGGAISYDPAKLAALKESLKADLAKLPLAAPTRLEDDIISLQKASVVNGKYDSELNRKLLNRLYRAAPLLYAADGTVRAEVAGAPLGRWQTEVSEALEKLGGAELDNLYRDGFKHHQSGLIEKLAEASRADRSLRAGLWLETLKKHNSNFLGKALEDALKPVALAKTAGEAEVRFLRLDEVLPPESVFRGCFGKDCSILSVPYYPEINGTKTYFIRKSPNTAHAPDGYVFVAPVEVKGRRLPYIVTVNGNLTADDVGKVIQAVGVDWGADRYVFADLAAQPYLVNDGNMRTGLKASGADKVKVSLPEGWSTIDDYLKNHSMGYSNYYATANLESAFVARIPPSGADFLKPISLTKAPPRARTSTVKLLSRPALDRAILGANALDGAPDGKLAGEIMKRLQLEERHIAAARKLSGAWQSGLSGADFSVLERDLGFAFRNILDLDLVSRSRSLVRLYHERPGIAPAEKWKSSLDATWLEIEENWLQASGAQKDQLFKEYVDATIRDWPADLWSPSTRFLDDAVGEVGAWSKAGRGARVFLLLIEKRRLSSAQIAEGLPNVMRFLEVNEKALALAASIIRDHEAAWPMETRRTLWDEYSSKVGVFAESGKGREAASKLLDEVPDSYRGKKWLVARISREFDPHSGGAHSYNWMVGKVLEFRRTHPGVDLEEVEKKLIHKTVMSLRYPHLASDNPAPVGVFHVLSVPEYRAEVLKEFPIEKLDETLISIADFSRFQSRYAPALLYMDKMGLFDRYWEKRGKGIHTWGVASEDFHYDRGLVETLNHPDLSERARGIVRRALQKEARERYQQPVRIYRSSYDGQGRYAWDTIYSLGNPYLKDLVGEREFLRVFRNLDKSLHEPFQSGTAEFERKRLIEWIRGLAVSAEHPETAFQVYRIAEKHGMADETTVQRFATRLEKDERLRAVVAKHDGRMARRMERIAAKKMSATAKRGVAARVVRCAVGKLRSTARTLPGRLIELIGL